MLMLRLGKKGVATLKQAKVPGRIMCSWKLGAWPVTLASRSVQAPADHRALAGECTVQGQFHSQTRPYIHCITKYVGQRLPTVVIASSFSDTYGEYLCILTTTDINPMP